MRILQVFALAGIVSGAALCQEAPAAAPLAFEVASIKPSEPIGGGMGKVMIRFGVQNDGAMVKYNGMTLKALVQNAYSVKDYQVTCAPWMDTERYDISAKLPDGANKDQAPEMLQNLLKERFKVTVHREKKDHAIYALVAGKSGPKLKASEISALEPGAPKAGDAGKTTAPPPGGPSQTAMVGGGPGGRGSLPQGGISMRMGPNGGHLEAKAMTLSRFAEAISRFLDRPVMDQTGIEGNYDFAIDISADEMGGMMAQMKGAMMMAGAGPAPGGAVAGGPVHGGPDGLPPGPEGGSLFQSIQSYGLKLEPKKAAMDMIAIDSAEKTPTEN